MSRNPKIIGDRVLVLPDPKESASPGGIVLPERAQTKQNRGRVITVGSGYRGENGMIPLTVVAGDQVVYMDQAQREVDVDGVTMLVMSEAEILLIL